MPACDVVWVVVGIAVMFLLVFGGIWWIHGRQPNR